MLGAIIGDIVGSRFEFDRGDKSREFELFTKACEFTDDTVMTIAVAEALMDAGRDAGEQTIKERLVSSMKKWGKKYPDAGYGARFSGWVLSPDPKPYGSYGNGSGMRVRSQGGPLKSRTTIRKESRARNPRRLPSSWRGPVPRMTRLESTSLTSSVMTLPARWMISARHTDMWKTACAPCRKRSSVSSRQIATSPHSETSCTSAATRTPSARSRVRLQRLVGVYRRASRLPQRISFRRRLRMSLTAPRNSPAGAART